MTLHVKQNKFRLALWCPNIFLWFVVKSVLKHDKHTKGGKLNRKEIRQIVNGLRQAKKFHGKLELVSVKSSDGARVRIVI